MVSGFTYAANFTTQAPYIKVDTMTQKTLEDKLETIAVSLQGQHSLKK